MAKRKTSTTYCRQRNRIPEYNSHQGQIIRKPFDRRYQLLVIFLHRIPIILRSDRETSFTSMDFRESAENVGIELQFRGIEDEKSIGQGERYQDSRRRIFNVIYETNTKMDSNSKLRIAIKAIKDTMGTNVLVRRLLV